MSFTDRLYYYREISLILVKSLANSLKSEFQNELHVRQSSTRFLFIRKWFVRK